MPYSEIRQVIKDSLRSRYFRYLWALRALTTVFPLISTFLFSRVVAALESGAPLTTVLLILFMALMLQLTDNLLRLYSKTRLDYVIGKLSLDIQSKLLVVLPPKIRANKGTIQACINLSLSVERLLIYVKETGISGIVYFIFVPLILLFIDVKIFFVELIFIIIYLFFTVNFNKKYEKLYEIYNASRETYYARLFASKNTSQEVGFLLSRYNIVQQFVFFMWNTFQNSVAIFQFIIPLIVAIDILGGVKHLSDLVLIVGYTRESQSFLNEFSTSYEKLMEIEAGIKRLEKDTLLQSTA